MADYTVHYARKADKVSAKVFKWKTIELAAGEEIELTKKRNIKQTSLRALYPGTHLVELKINDIRMANSEYELR